MNGPDLNLAPGLLSVVIPSVRPERAVGLVRTVRKCVGDAVEIVVVDDTAAGTVSTALAIVVAEPGHERTNVVRGRSAGPAVARNLGATSASGSWVLFIDDDVTIGSGALSVARHFAATHGYQDALEFSIVSDGGAIDGSWRWRRVQRLVQGGYLAACILISRQAFTDVGGFEESWPYPFREDTDLGLRLGATGVRWHFESEPLVTHPDERVTFKQLMRHARFSVVEPLYLKRHGMAGTIRGVRIGPFTIRGVRIWWPAASLLTVVVLLLLRIPLLAALVAYVSGSVLSTSHSQYLGRAQPVDLAMAVSPTRVLPWTVFSAVSGASFIRGWLPARPSS